MSNQFWKFILALAMILTTASYASAQSTKDRLELGVQASSLTIFNPDFDGDFSQLGPGARIAYNLNRSMAVEAELNFFPQKGGFNIGEGRAVQGQFGVKIGKRFDKFGVFAKVRPGFLSVGRVFSLEQGATLVFNGFTQPNARIGRKTYFTTDIGGVLEFYPSKRTLVRFEAGDTLVHYGPAYHYDIINFPNLLLSRPGKFTNNFQLTAGVGFRFGDFPNEKDVTTPAGNSKPNSPRFELGAQFTSMSVHPPTPICGGCVSVVTDTIVTEPGLGGRFTYNISESVALEAEGNFYTRDRLNFIGPGGHMFQGQFGVKAGKRFEQWGIFAKARPGFVGFSEVNQLVGTHTQLFGTTTIIVPDFRLAKKLYPSIDVGGVLELYVSRRWMTRFDLGDTIVRYGEFAVPGFVISLPILTRPAETQHNFQFTAGMGFRF